MSSEESSTRPCPRGRNGDSADRDTCPKCSRDSYGMSEGSIGGFSREKLIPRRLSFLSVNLFNAKSYFDGTRSLNNKSNIYGLYYVSRIEDEAHTFSVSNFTSY